MPDLLWSWTDLIAATGGRPDGPPLVGVGGVSIDTRTLEPGDLFVALRDQRDGHDFVETAFKAGAATALVQEAYQRKPGDGSMIRVQDPLAGLVLLGRAARVRCNARVVAVTGSVGKTGTKEMLRQALSELGATHASEKSYNNHWGVPLTLARMPQNAEFAVFEIGMNHAGEIVPLVEMVRPHVAVITTVEPVHLEFFPSVEAIAEAKSEIFGGLVPGGTAVLPRDNGHFALLRERATTVGARIVTFGFHEEADVRPIQVDMTPRGSSVIAGYDSQRFPYRLGAPGEHYVRNSLAVLATLLALRADIMRTLPALARVGAPVGRGARKQLQTGDGGSILLIDESYNANPASVRAALSALAATPREEYPRRIAVLGDMLELGDTSAERHRALKEAVDAAGVDLVLACGPMMRLLFDDLGKTQQGSWAPTSDQLVEPLLNTVRAGDVVMIKGSLGSRMAPVVAGMLARYEQGRAGG